MKECKFLSSDSARERYEDIIPVYQKAFAGEPWFEVSKCADKQGSEKKCKSGYSPLKVGEFCEDCDLRTQEEAYPALELLEKFNSFDRKTTLWYLEEVPEGVATVSVSWLTTPQELAQKKYAGNPAMSRWLAETLDTENVVWFDDWFSDLDLSPSGNMKNFGDVAREFMDKLGVGVLAFRTINPRVIRSAIRDLGVNVRIYKANEEVPDWRDFIVIKK